MDHFFVGFADELMKLAKDPFAELDVYMKQKGIKAPPALKAKPKPVKPMPQPSRKQILGGAQMGVKTVAPGSAQAKAIARKAQTYKPPPSVAEQQREKARKTYERNLRIRQQQEELR